MKNIYETHEEYVTLRHVGRVYLSLHQWPGVFHVNGDLFGRRSHHQSHCKEQECKIRTRFCPHVSAVAEYSCFCLLTFRRHSSLCCDNIWITSELLQASDGTLADHRLPAEWTVVNHLDHNGRRVHLILWKELNGGFRWDVKSIYKSTEVQHHFPQFLL